MDSSADTWQRARDKARVERRLGLPEWAAAGTQPFEFRDKSGLVVARGYTRVLYGDHGAYLELERAHLLWRADDGEKFECGAGFWLSAVNFVGDQYVF